MAKTSGGGGRKAGGGAPPNPMARVQQTNPPNAVLKQKTVGQVALNLTPGEAYVASRPVLERGQTKVDVEITNQRTGAVEATVTSLSIKTADDFLGTFNKRGGARIW